MATPQLDVHRAESSRQHVRALNSQFASWVQTQLKNHPDELWEDGVQDYLTHASTIMDKYSDVVQWLKANALNGENSSGAGSGTIEIEKEKTPDKKYYETKLFQGKSGLDPVGTAASFGMSWGSGGRSSPFGSTASETPPMKNEINPFQGKPLFAPVGTTTSFATSWSFGGSSSAMGSSAGEKAPVGNSFQGNTGFAPLGTTTSFGTSWSSGVFSASQTPALFGNQSSVSVNHDASEDADGENDLEHPGSPSVKKAEEKGTVEVHEVKCKLYVKSTDPDDKDAWKDKGAGQLSIKCQEGVSKGIKESKPTILIRNDISVLCSETMLKETRHPVYRGIRKRNKDKWVCEMRKPVAQTRVWLGTYPTAEMAARAHDVAALAFQGRAACLNFADSSWRLPVPASLDPKDIKRAAAEAAEAFRTQDCEGSVSGTEQALQQDMGAFSDNMFFMDEQLPGLMADMADGMLISPPRTGNCSSLDDTGDDGGVSLWSYSI